ncbi:MAG: hypothetical protein EPO68_17765 [Planctomycetota bacterium]|nr:MAG: hypothetical protein EPO68_17765 [Planctomycetota bacterium]
MLAPLLLSGVIVVAETPGFGVDYISIQDAVHFANDGDIVLVRSGTYVGDVSAPVGGKNVVIVADGPTAPYSILGLWTFHTQQPSQTLVVRGLDLAGLYAPLPNSNTTLQVSQGNVLVEDCTIYGAQSSVRADASGWLALTRSGAYASSGAGPGPISAIGTGLETAPGASSLATLHSSYVSGGGGLFNDTGVLEYGIDAREAVNWTGKLIASHASIQGGIGMGSKLATSGGCIASAPGSALLLNGTAHLAATTVVAGAFWAQLDGCPLPPVPPASIGGTTVVHAGTAPLLSSSRVTREGQLLTATLDAASGEYGVLLVATSVQRVELDAYVGVLVNPAASVVPLGFVGGSGSLSKSAVVQELGAGVEGAAVYLQGASVDPATLSVRLSNVSVATLLDAGL